MNYITRLEQTVKMHEQAWNDLERYLCSEKFAHPDDYVHTNDVLLRIQELRQELPLRDGYVQA